MLFLFQLGSIYTNHDDVIKWKHFPRYWPFLRGIHRSPVNSPHKGQWRGALMFSLICVWINGWVNNREAGDLRRHRAHYDVSVMIALTESWFRVFAVRAQVTVVRHNRDRCLCSTGTTVTNCGTTVTCSTGKSCHACDHVPPCDLENKQMSFTAAGESWYANRTNKRKCHTQVCYVIKSPSSWFVYYAISVRKSTRMHHICVL